MLPPGRLDRETGLRKKGGVMIHAEAGASEEEGEKKEDKEHWSSRILVCGPVALRRTKYTGTVR